MTISSLSQFLNTQTSSSGLSNSASSALAEKLKSTTNKTTDTTTESSADGDQITLSASAKALLAAQEQAKEKTKKNYGFTLTEQQQSDLAAVIAKYKDKPINQANYDALQKDLKKLRLDTVSMAAKDSAKSFSIKGMMLSIMNGTDVSGNAAARAQASAVKKDAYAKQIVADWTALQPATSTSSTS